MILNNFTKKSKWALWLMAILLIAGVSACGGAQPEEVALSEQVPVRRGSVDVLGQVQEITAEILDIPEADVVETADFRDDLDADDDEMTRLGEAFAEAFGVEISEQEVNDLTTVKSAVDLIESK